MKLTTLRRKNAERQAEWPGGEHADLNFRGLELAGETGELINLLKKKVRMDTGISGTTESKNELQLMLADELADVVICLDLVGMELGVPLADPPSLMDMTEGEIAEWTNLSHVGNVLNGRVGLVNEEIAEEIAIQDPEQTANRLSGALLVVCFIAELVGVNISVAVPMKFNATSAKHGLATRMSM